MMRWTAACDVVGRVAVRRRTCAVVQQTVAVTRSAPHCANACLRSMRALLNAGVDNSKLTGDDQSVLLWWGGRVMMTC